MVDAAALRQALAAFLGEEQFRKFVRQGYRSGRLRYWQEQEWVRFTAAHPEFVVGTDELAVALRVCELHGLELLPETVELFRGNIDYAESYLDARKRHSRRGVRAGVHGGHAPFEGDRAEVWYCPACRQAESVWKARRV